MTKEEIINHSQEIPGWCTPEEASHLYELAKTYIKPHGMAIEIGTHQGRSAYVIGSVCKDLGATLYCIDTFGEDIHTATKPTSATLLESASNNLKDLPVKILVGLSQNELPKLANQSFDFAYVDGDHHVPQVKFDIQETCKKISPGGVICGHDYGNPCDVKAVVDELFEDRVQVFGIIWRVQYDRSHSLCE